MSTNFKKERESEKMLTTEINHSQTSSANCGLCLRSRALLRNRGIALSFPYEIGHTAVRLRGRVDI